MAEDEKKAVPLVSLGDILTDEQIRSVIKIGNDPARVTREVIEPNLAAIDKKLGQGNDAHYLGYAICDVLDRTGAFDTPATFLLHGRN